MLKAGFGVAEDLRRLAVLHPVAFGAAKQAGLQRKRMLLEKQLREEQEECAKDSQLETWLIMVRQDSTTSSARISVNSITCRALAKASVPR